MEGHQNLSALAENEESLHRLWDADIKKHIKRRIWRECIGFFLFAPATVAYGSGIPDWTIACLIGAAYFLYTAIKCAVDESNANYLMHQWELDDALTKLRWEERQRFESEMHESASEGQFTSDFWTSRVRT
jgi:hypothetical protein